MLATKVGNVHLLDNMDRFTHEMFSTYFSFLTTVRLLSADTDSTAQIFFGSGLIPPLLLSSQDNLFQPKEKNIFKFHFQLVFMYPIKNDLNIVPVFL